VIWIESPSFRAIFNRAAEDFKLIEHMAWQITEKMVNMSHARMISKLTTRVKNNLKKLDKQANNFSQLSDQIFETSWMYHAVSLALSSRGGPPPQWNVPATNATTPLNFFPFIFKEFGVVTLVTADVAKPPDLEPAP